MNVAIEGKPDSNGDTATESNFPQPAFTMQTLRSRCMWHRVWEFEGELDSDGGVRLDGGALLDEGHVTHGGDHNLSKNNFTTNIVAR